MAQKSAVVDYSIGKSTMLYSVWGDLARRSRSIVGAVETSLVDPTSRSLGSLGRVGPLAFGCWRLTTDSLSEAQRLIESALDNGLNLIDNADVYGFDWGGTGFGACESLLGRVLKVAPALRSRMVLASKGGIWPGVPYDQSEAYLRSACEASLARLGVDRIDLYQIHRPDLYTHPAALAETLTALRAAGKIGEVGVSNFTAAQTEALAHFLPFPLVATQPEFSPAALGALRDGTLDLAMRAGVTPLAWSPLAGGRLMSGDGIRPELLAVLDRLADRERVDRAAICVAFVLAHPSRPVAIIGSQRVERLTAAAAALHVQLDRTDCYAIVEASEGVPLP
jgi:predicted oxidoreductase